MPANRWLSLVGFVGAVLLCALPAEMFLRYFPPAETFPGFQSSVGILAADAHFGVGYRSWEAFRAQNAADLASLLTPIEPDHRPAWIFLGNSFVHGPGMLVDHVRLAVPSRLVATLHRSDPLPLRCAQLALLEVHAPRVERMFAPLSTVDLLGLGEQPLATLRISADGALSYAPRLPPEPWAWMIRHSGLAAAAWSRTGRQRGNPEFDKRALDLRIDEPLRSDLHTLFANLARAVDGLPLTVILIPSYQQLVRNVGDGFQQHLRALLQPLGYDVFDPLPALRRHPHPEELFLPDKHFSPRANRLLVEALLEHLHVPTAAVASPPA